MGLAVVVVLLTGVTILAVAGSRRAVESVSKSTLLADAYLRADAAVTAEESLERKYRLEPALGVRAHFAAAADGLTAALEEVRHRGGASDRVLVDRVEVEHVGYVTATERLFDAVDRKNPAEALRNDATSETALRLIEGQVDGAADEHRERALAQMRSLRRTQSAAFLVVLVAFAVGLLLLVFFGRLLAHQRRLAAEAYASQRRALQDPLTGLPNRTAFTARVESSLAGRAASPTTTGSLAVLLLDLDRFKEVNDTLGHHHGDLLLIAVSRRLAEALRPEDTLARLAGDEFAVLLPEVADAATALQIGRRMVAALRDPCELEGVPVAVEVSVGISLAGAHGRTCLDLIRAADAAMYAAKRNRAGCLIYQSDEADSNPTRLGLLGELRRAVENAEFALHYQPCVELRSGQLIGVEALLRWQHPTRGLLAPSEFLPVAEDSGIMPALTDLVLHRALADARQWLNQPVPIPVAVNVSAHSLLDPTFPDRVAALLDRVGLPAGLLKLEITEHSLLTDPSSAGAVLATVSGLGVRIAIDDFGTGYSSLAHLQALPVDELKIDRRFVRTVARGRREAALTKAVLDLGRDLGLDVIAEGVEDAATLRALTEMRCEHAQGYFIARPMPAGHLEGWMTNNHRTPSAPRR